MNNHVSFSGELVIPTPADVVAQTIGDGITGAEVDGFLEMAKEQRLLLHGIKRASSVANVKANGVLPLSAEGGPGSYWATGNQIFYTDIPTQESGMWSFNTAFFDHGGSRNEKGIPYMAIAITDIGRLSTQGTVPVNWRENGECVVREVVDPAILTIVTVEGEEVRENMFKFLLKSARSQQLTSSGIWDL